MKRVTKHPSYRAAIAYIALNDEPCELDAKQVTGMPSVHLVSVIFGTPADVVAQDVVDYRAADAVREG